MPFAICSLSFAFLDFAFFKQFFFAAFPCVREEKKSTLFVYFRGNEFLISVIRDSFFFSAREPCQGPPCTTLIIMSTLCFKKFNRQRIKQTKQSFTGDDRSIDSMQKANHALSQRRNTDNSNFLTEVLEDV